jgi:DNA-binding transcriptional regulator YhcF (GntR family)
MLTEIIPEGTDMPTEPIGMKELAAMYHRSPSTLQRAFNLLGIYDAIGERLTRDFTPEQQLIIFALYFAPSKYYHAYLALEKSGYIESLLKKHNLIDFTKNRKQQKQSRAADKKIKNSKVRKKKT